jgi:hypothetical protein
MPRPPEAAPDFRYADADDGDLHLIEGARVFAGAVEIAPVGGGGGGGGGGTVASIVEGVGVDIDSSDPVNPIVSIGQDVSPTVQPTFNGLNVLAPSGAGILVDYRGPDGTGVGDGGVYIDVGDNAMCQIRRRNASGVTNLLVINPDGSLNIFNPINVLGYAALTGGLRSDSDLYIDTTSAGRNIHFRIGFIPTLTLDASNYSIISELGDLILKGSGATVRDGAGNNLLPAYKAYRAIISQSEFGMVTVHEGENHTGAAITWGSDVAPGVIIGTADAPIFDVTKTFVNIGPIPQDPSGGNNYDVGYFIVSPTQIKVSSWWKQAGMLDQLLDGVLTNTPIEILNYP